MNKTEIINHLTKEIEILSTNIMNFRTRISFSLWIGPFLILGSVIVSAPKNGLGLSISDRGAWIAVVLAAIAFVGLGGIAGGIEHQAWNKCNEWRRCIIRLQSDATMTEKELESFLVDEKIAKNIRLFYEIVFLAILLPFGAIAYLAAEFVRGSAVQ